MEASYLRMEILQRIYLKKSIWELETIAGFNQVLRSLFEKGYVCKDEGTPPNTYDPYANIKLTTRGAAVAIGHVV